MTISPQPLVSVLTPVHNGEQYLSECIESVLGQTYANWHYTIVDNCSTDQTLAIAREYASRDPRIRVIRNSRLLPVLQNHNHTIRQISSESKYCKFVFADDWIYPECLQFMVAVAEEYPSVGIVGAYVLEDRNITCTGLPYTVKVLNGREMCRQHILNRLHVFGSPNAVLYRAELVRGRNPFFNEANVHADTEACFYLLKSSDMGFVHQVLTFTRHRPLSRTELSNEMQTCYAGTLRILTMHGSDYLTRTELQHVLRSHISEYYAFLGKCLLLGQRKTIEYHRRKLIEAGVGFKWARVLSGALATGRRLALNPVGTAAKLMKASEPQPLSVREEYQSAACGLRQNSRVSLE